MCRRRSDATRSLYTHRFAPPSILAMLIFWLSLLSATQSVEIQIYGISPTSLQHAPQFSVRKNVADNTEPLSPYEVVYRLDAATTFRVNVLTSIGRILLLRLDEESRISFEIIYEALRTRYVPAYDYISLVPVIQGKISRQQLYSVLRLMQRISTPYISSYATLCLEALSDGRVNMELTSPTDLLFGIDNNTRSSLAIDKKRIIEAPLTFDDAVSTLMTAIAKDRTQPDLELVAALMLNLPNFDLKNPEVPEAMKYVAKYMKQNSKPNDPIFEYLSADHMSGADKLVKVVLERLMVSGSASSILRESLGLLLQNFREKENRVEFRKWNKTELFDVIVPDFYPRSIVAIANYFQRNFNRVMDQSLDFVTDLSPYTTELQALGAVVTQLYKNPSLPEPVRESAAALGSFVIQKERDEDFEQSLEEVTFHRALEYLEAFRSPCLPEKLRVAAEMLRPYLNEKLPWNYAFGDTRLSGNPYELLVNALINLRNIKMSDKILRFIDNFIYHAKSNGVDGKRSIIYDHGIIFQREDSDVVELDVYSLLARLPNIFHDKRFAVLLTFFSKPNLLDYLGHGFNMFAHIKPRALLMNLINVAGDKPAVRTDEELYKALKVAKVILEEPTLVNTYSSEELQDILKALPAIDVDPRYLPIKLLFKKQNLFKYISPTFSLAGLETPLQHIALILNTITLKPIDKRLEESIIFVLTNLEGPQLPARSFTRDDFVYLVTHLLRHDKKMEIAILESRVYRTVSNWNISVSGTPENVLARTLGYPIEILSRNNELSAIIKKAEKILEEETSLEIQLVNKKTLDNMLQYLPDTENLRPVNLLLKKSNLAMFLPKLNVSSLGNHQPRDALIILLENLTSSPHIKREIFLSKRLQIALESVKKSAHPPAHDVSSVATEELLNPLARKYQPLRKKFKELNGNLTLKHDKLILKEFLLRIREDTNDVKLAEAARLALKEIYYGVDSGMIPAIKDTEILEALSLLPNEPALDPLKTLLTPSWILDVLPDDFQSAEYPSKEQILRIILFMTKQRPEIMENPLLMSAISAAENSLVNWKHDVEPLRKIVGDLKDSLYEPVKDLLRAQNLNKLELNFLFDSRQTPKQLLVGLLHNLMLHPKITANSQVMHVLDSLRQDVLNFGLDSDLLWVLDDAGIPYNPDLAPVRLFLHKTVTNSRLGPLVNQVNGSQDRFKMLMDCLSKDKYVAANQELRNSFRELRKITPRFKNPLQGTVTDIMDIVNSLPNEILRKYPDVEKLFVSDTMKEIPSYSGILDSPQPVMTLLLKLGELPKVLRDQDLGTKVLEFYKALGDVIYKPVISGYNLRPLLRELHHARQMNVDYILQIINPKVLSVLLPEGVEYYDNARADTMLLSNILEEVLAQRVVDIDVEFKRHVSSLQRDLVLIAGEKNKRKEILSDQEIKEILKLIPNSKEFEAIRYVIEAKQGFDQIPQSFVWRKFPTPLKKLMKILDFVVRHSESDNYLHDSVLALNTYLFRKYFFISDNDVRMLLGALNGCSVNHDLVPLRLFMTKENLVMYLPSDINIKRFATPEKAMSAILDILRDNEKLKTNTLLQNSIVVANEAVRENSLAVKRKAFYELTRYDLRFILNLNIRSQILKNYLNPASLVNILPKSFSFASKPTFKAKVLHLLNYLVSNEMGPVEEIREIIREVNFLNDLPSINRTDLEQLVAAIDENAVDVDFQLINKYLTVKKLVKLLPGNFDIKNNTNVKEVLLELIRTVSHSISGTEKRAIVEFEKLLNELRKPSSSIIKTRANIKPVELNSLIAEIPFKECKNIGSLRQKLREDVVLKMLPVNLNLELLKTRKLKLLEILRKIEKHPGATEFGEMVKLALKCVEKMQDVPKLNDRDISKTLKSSDLNKKDLTMLLENCKVLDIAEHLPIAFDIRDVKSYRGKFKAVIDSCEKLKFSTIEMKVALKNAEILMKKLPSADITREELNQTLSEIYCCNFTAIKPLMKFTATNDLLSFLPLTLNFDKESTVKRKLLSLLTALRNLKQFQNEEMFRALDTAEKIAHRLQNKPLMTQLDIDNLKQLPVMMAPEVSHFAKIFLLNNLIKVVPPSFNINDYETERPRLVHLLKYSKNMNPIKINDKYKASINVVHKRLLRKAEQETLDYLERLIKNDDEHIPLLLYVHSQKRAFFDPIKIDHGFEYPKIEDRLRVVLKYMLGMEKVVRSESVVKSIESLISQLSNGEPTDYEISEAISEVPDLKQNQDLKMYLRFREVQNQAKALTLTPEHTAKRLLLDILRVVKITTVDGETIAAIGRMISDLQKAVWDTEVEELFKQIRNYELYLGKLKTVRLYYIQHGPEAILGANYHDELPSKFERLKKLVEVLLASEDLKRDEELKTGVEYLNEILTNPSNSTSMEQAKTMQDIDMKSLFSVLPKIRSEKLILGLLKFFTDPKLVETLDQGVDPSRFKSQGQLMQGIVNFSLTLNKVKNDPEQLKALEYVKDKILMTNSGALPIKLNTLSRHATTRPDLIGLLKSVDIRSVNLSIVMPIAKFFDTKYDPLIHGRGFDHQAHTTRGTYLKALLEYLIANVDVEQDIKRHAKALINYVRLDGPGGEPVDVNEDTTPGNRIFYIESYPDYSQVGMPLGVNFHRGNRPYARNMIDLNSHFSNHHPHNPWEQALVAKTVFKVHPEPNNLTKLVQNEREVSEEQIFEKERFKLKTSIDRIINSGSKVQSIVEEPRTETMLNSAGFDSYEDGDADNGNKWSSEFEEERKTVEKGIKKTLGFVKMILPQLNETDNNNPKISQTNGKKSYKREASKDFKTSQLTEEEEFDPESATFSPDKVLVDVKTRMNEGPLSKPVLEEEAYITEEEALKLTQKEHLPIRPLPVDSRDLPVETDSEYEDIPHTVSKTPKRVNLVSRKLFIRNDTDADLVNEHRELTADISIKDHRNFKHENKTVKKDLSQLISVHYPVLIDSQWEIIPNQNGTMDLIPTPEALTLQIPKPTDTIAGNLTNVGIDFKVESKDPSFGIKAKSLTRGNLNRQLTDDIAVEEFKAHELQNGTRKTTLPPKAVDQTRKIIEPDQDVPMHINIDNDDHVEVTIPEDHAIERIIDSSSSATIIEKLSDAEKFSSSTAKDRTALVEDIVPRVFLNDDYLDVPVAAEDKLTHYGNDYGNFHQPFPKIEQMFRESFRRKRSTNYGVPMVQPKKTPITIRDNSAKENIRIGTNDEDTSER